MGNTTSGTFVIPTDWKKYKMLSKKKEKWKNIRNLINTEDSEHFEINKSVAISSHEREDKVTTKNLPRYVDHQFYQQSNENVPVVLINTAALHQFDYKELYLPLGTVLNVISKQKDWLHVQTAHGQEGYINREICLPLKVSTSPNDSYFLSNINYGIDKYIFKEFEFSGDSTSDDATIDYNERNVDILYLQATGTQRKAKKLRNVDKRLNEHRLHKPSILTIRNDYISNGKCTLSVRKEEMVFLIHNHLRGWFWVRNRNNEEGFIPTVIASYGIAENG